MPARAGVDVVERHVRSGRAASEAWGPGCRSAPRSRAPRRGCCVGDRPFDAVVVGYPGHLDLAGGARPRAGGRSSSTRSSRSPTRSSATAGASAPARSRRARSRRVDRRALRAADLVVADTEANADFLAAGSACRASAVAVCFVGAEERVFRPGWRRATRSRALRRQADPAARPRDDPRGGAARARVRFRVVGSGQLDRLLAAGRRTSSGCRWVEYERLPGRAARGGLRARHLRHVREGRR